MGLRRIGDDIAVLLDIVLWGLPAHRSLVFVLLDREAPMSLSDAKLQLQWAVVEQALIEANVDGDVRALVEQAKNVHAVVMGMTQTLLGLANVAAPNNYVKVEMTGMLPPFERAYVELVRPGGATSHELRALLRERLTCIEGQLTDHDIKHDSYREGMLIAIRRDLAKESPGGGHA